MTPDLSFETALRRQGVHRVAGVDEAGRGPLAGPVVAAAVVLRGKVPPKGVADSKKLSAARREAVFERIEACCHVGVGIASVEEIDRLNILRASHLAMCRALESLPIPADYALIDGNMVPQDLSIPAEPVVKGDARCASIAAASIVAKVSRDRIMVDLAQQYPDYGWDRNAAYPTPEHLRALRDFGVTPHHRRSFAPVHKILVEKND
ncbi:MAG: ribonuclease HII [Pseudomonadota bacterium]